MMYMGKEVYNVKDYFNGVKYVFQIGFEFVVVQFIMESKLQVIVFYINLN